MSPRLPPSPTLLPPATRTNPTPTKPACRTAQISEEIKLAKDDSDEDKVAGMEFFFPKGTPVWVKVRPRGGCAGGGGVVCVGEWGVGGTGGGGRPGRGMVWGEASVPRIEMKTCGATGGE